MQTPETYYENDELWGGYQYIPLKEIVNGMMVEVNDDDSLLKNTKRSKILFHAKQGVRELNRSVANDIRAYEITVPDSLVFPVPQDFVNYVRISVVLRDNVTGSLRLFPLDINYKINSAIGYLQDHNAEILFDDEGQILMSESSNAIAQPYKRYAFYNVTNQPTLNTAKLSKYGEFSIDPRRGLMLFSSDLADKEIVVEYVSDGLHAELNEEEVTIHKYLKKALEEYIFYECIRWKRNVPHNRISEAKNNYLSTRHKAVLALSDISVDRVSRAIQTNSML